MTPIMITTMVICFALTISVAVSIGLASILGIQVDQREHAHLGEGDVQFAINKFPLAAIPFLHPGRQPDGKRRHLAPAGGIRQESWSAACKAGCR